MKGFDCLNLNHLLESMTSVIGKDLIFENEPMKKHTSFKVGGNADLLITPSKEEELALTVSLLNKNEVPYVVIGNGSNLIVGDNGIRGVVVKISDKLSDVTLESKSGDDVLIKAQAGILLSRLANWSLSKELKGLEFASGIPGTLGGAVAMNAGAYDGEMSFVVVETKYFDCIREEFMTVSGEEHKFSYRSSIFQDNKDAVIFDTKMRLSYGDKVAIRERMDELTKRRKDKQPLEYPSAGSTFKRPVNNYASKLIEDCGLKGLRSGGAMVSEKHAGFIINTGDATAKDILNLIDIVKREVLNKTGVVLNEEVKILGE